MLFVSENRSTKIIYLSTPVIFGFLLKALKTKIRQVNLYNQISQILHFLQGLLQSSQHTTPSILRLTQILIRRKLPLLTRKELEETSGSAAEEGSFSQYGHTCNTRHVYRTKQRKISMDNQKDKVTDRLLRIQVNSSRFLVTIKMVLQNESL